MSGRYRISQRRGRFLGAAPSLAGALVLLIPAARVSAQLNDQQNFNGNPPPGLNALFAVPPNPVTNWSLDGACSGGTVFVDGNKGDNGTGCLRTLIPAGTGTRMIRDLNPGPGSSTIGAMAVTVIDVQYRLLLVADDGSGANGQELYQVLQALYPIMTLKSDIKPGPGSSNPQNFFAHTPGSAVSIYFSADDGTTGRELWLSRMNPDMVSTTSLVKDINPSGSSSPSSFAAGPAPGGGVPAIALFAADDGTNGRELWKTDGDTLGTTTVMVKDINTSAGASSDPQLLTSVVMVVNTDIKVFFTADDGVNGRELWRSDGTSGGTGICKNIVAGSTSSNPTNLTAGNPLVAGVATPTLFFTVDSDGINGQELWKSRGALDGSDTVQVKDVGASPTSLKAVGNRLFFTVGNDLWKSDGTTTGTVLVQSFSSISAGSLVVLGTTTVYFAADNGAGHGVELWKSDGTTTIEVKDIYPGAGSSSPSNLTTMNGMVYFSADDGPGAGENHGRELWRSDATLGAVLIKDINPGSAGSNPSKFNEIEKVPDGSTGANLGPFGSVAFTAEDGTHGTELWQTDGVVGGVADHAGMSYKWNMVPVIQGHDVSKSAVAGTDSNVFSVYWMHDFSSQGGTQSFSDPPHQTNFYMELTDGIDRAPLNITNVDCLDGNLPRPSAALTDGSDHKAIAFGMVAVLDQNPCDTDSRLPGSPGVPVAHVPAIYDGHDWIPMDLAHIPAGVPSNPPSASSLARAAWVQIAVNSTLPGGLAASGDDPWLTRRFANMRIDVWTDYIRVIAASKQSNFLYVATVPRKYKGGFKALYLGNKACLQQPYLFFTDTINLNGGLLTTSTTPYGACCGTSGCSNAASAAACPNPGVFSAWKACNDSNYTCCGKPWADADHDGDVDMVDFGVLQACFTGSGGGVPAGCTCFNHAAGTGIDSLDLDEFSKCVAGTVNGSDYTHGPSAGVPWNQATTPNCTPCPASPAIAVGCP